MVFVNLSLWVLSIRTLYQIIVMSVFFFIKIKIEVVVFLSDITMFEKRKMLAHITTSASKISNL